MRTVAVVPVKHTSERLKNKNFRDFHDGESLLERKLRQLKECGRLDAVYVSSDSVIAREISKSAATSFIERDKAFCNNDLRWSEVIAEVLRTLPERDNTVIVWAHATSPFFNEFGLAIDKFYAGQAENEYDGLVAVQEVRSYLLDPAGNPVNYGWGPWHRYSQDLPDYLAVTGGVFILPLGEARALKYLVSRKPNFYRVDSIAGVDVDSLEDFEYAQFVAERGLEK